jgi:hypothetical protein
LIAFDPTYTIEMVSFTVHRDHLLERIRPATQASRWANPKSYATSRNIRSSSTPSGFGYSRGADASFSARART